MASRTIQDQVSSLLSRNIANGNSGGAPTPDIDSAALFESVAINLLLNPRTVLYAAHLARNGLIGAANAELLAVQSLRQDIEDTANTPYAITDPSALSSAKTALLQIESQQRISPSTDAFKSFSTSVDSFLNAQLAKNVKIAGAASLARPATEAYADMAGDLSVLKTQHAALLDRLYSLSVGVQNFIASPLSATLGASAAGRARRDIEQMISSLKRDSSGSNARDMATALLADRAALKMLGSPPKIDGPLLDSVSATPPGYRLQAYSGPAPAPCSSSVGPFSIPSSPSSPEFEITVGGAPLSLPGSSLVQGGNDAAILGQPVSWPVSIPAYTHLYLTLALSSQPDSSWIDNGNGLFAKNFMVELNPSSSSVSMAQADVITAVATSLGSYGSAVEFVQAGSGRLLIHANVELLAIAAVFSEPDSSSTIGLPRTYTDSAHASLGFSLGDSGLSSNIPTSSLVDALNLLAPSAIRASRNSDGSFTITTITDTPGTSLIVGGSYATAWGMAGSFVAESTQVFLQGTINNTPTSSVPAFASALMDVGDSVWLPTGNSTVAKVTNAAITLTSPVPTFLAGNVTVLSALVSAWEILQSAANAQAGIWMTSSFGKGLSTLDASVASVIGQSTLASRKKAVATLDSLTAMLSDLVAALSVQASLLPIGSASEEALNATTILNSLTEKNYDKAADYFSQCKLREIFALDYQSASYGGAVMASASTFAQANVTFINTATDDDTTADGLLDQRGV